MLFHLFNLLWTVTGAPNVSGAWYGFWSGIGSDIGEAVIIGAVWRKVNCHAAGCWRIGLHKVGGTHYITCAKHHPNHVGSKKHSAEQIAVAHAKANNLDNAASPQSEENHANPHDPSEEHVGTVVGVVQVVGEGLEGNASQDHLSTHL
jgi:hypothetical protein